MFKLLFDREATILPVFNCRDSPGIMNQAAAYALRDNLDALFLFLLEVDFVVEVIPEVVAQTRCASRLRAFYSL